MYRYETHLHTWPVSKCGKAGVRETLEYYKSRGYDGVFITNHFLDGNLNFDKSCPYEEQLRFYVADYKEAKSMSEEIGIKVFFGIESSIHGADFLVYGLSPEWFFDHPEIIGMEKCEKLQFFKDAGAFLVHAHPFREARYIPYIRLFPKQTDAVEVVNANNTNESQNRVAECYAKEYGFFRSAGSDNHAGGRCQKFAGIETETPIMDEQDFIARIRNGQTRIFTEILVPDETETKL